jgi:hypothetical protein
MLRKIPIVGRIVEEINNDPYKERLKNSLRRKCITAATASAFLSGGAAAASAGALAFVGTVWDDIDRQIDQMTEEEAMKAHLVLSAGLPV